jgi:DNA-binding transcriptional regulator YiaG
MPNIASILKAEISRVARKTVKAETQTLKDAVAKYRGEIAALKKRAASLESELRRQGAPGRQRAAAAPAAAADAGASTSKLRYSAKGLIAQRRRLGLSAEQMGQLIGASGQSVYNWEAGKARPRDKHLGVIASLKSMGKKEAMARLAGPSSEA